MIEAAARLRHISLENTGKPRFIDANERSRDQRSGATTPSGRTGGSRGLPTFLE
jgi:hypothetical protein